MDIAKDISKSFSEKLVIAKVLALPSRDVRVRILLLTFRALRRWMANSGTLNGR